MGKLLTLLALLACAAAAVTHWTPLDEWNPVEDVIQGTVDAAVTSYVNSTEEYVTNTCQAMLASGGTLEDCPVLMTPDELEAATND